MREWKVGLILAAAILTVAPAQARHNKAVSVDEVSGPSASCTVVAEYPPYVYPAPNWEPFFRHHFYRYALVQTCLPI